MRVLGIDPGLATVGIGIVDAENRFAMRAVDWMTIKTKAGLSLPERLREIREDLLGLVREMQPTMAVVERLFFATNQVSAIEVAQARGVILLTLAELSLTIMEPTPLEVKLAITGDGQADKRQMQDMMVRLLNLPGPPRPVDAADALGMAVYGILKDA